MNSNDNNSMIKRLTFENFIWIAFIIISALDIYGDELLKRNIRYHDQKAEKRANKLFTGIAYFSVIIYIYFLLRNYSDYKKYKNKNYEIRLLGSIFILIGSICLLYFLKNTTNETDSPSNV